MAIGSKMAAVSISEIFANREDSCFVPYSFRRFGRIRPRHVWFALVLRISRPINRDLKAAMVSSALILNFNS